MDRQGEVLMWRGKCSGCSRPKLLNRCKPEPMGTQEYAKMLKRVQVLEDGGVPAKEARSWRIEGKKREELQEKSARGF